MGISHWNLRMVNRGLLFLGMGLCLLTSYSQAAAHTVPAISQIIPENGSAEVSTEQTIVVYLNDNIDPKTVKINLNNILCDPCITNTTEDDGYLKSEYETANHLEANTTYTVTINAQDMAGNKVSATSTFTTDDETE